MPKQKRVGGRIVVLSLIALAVLGCLGTIWRYSGLHVSTRDATVEALHGSPTVVARFEQTDGIAAGQKATMSPLADPALKVSGVVSDELPDGRFIIIPGTTLSFPTGTPLKVTVETPRP